MSEVVEQFEDPYKDMSIEEVAREYMAAKEILDVAKEVKAKAQVVFDRIRHHAIPDKMEEMGASSINLRGIGRVTVTGDMYAGIQPKMQMEAHQWLIENGHEDLIKDYVHPSTMKAFIKEQYKEGVEMPLDVFRIDAFLRGSITRK